MRIPEIIHLISLNGSKHKNDEIRELLANENFYVMIRVLNSSETNAYLLILTHYYGVKLQTPTNRSQSAYKQNVLMRRDTFLNQGQEPEIISLYNIAEKTGDYNFIYELANENPNRETVKRFFQIAYQNSESKIFKGRPFSHMASAIDTLMQTLEPENDLPLGIVGQRFADESNAASNFLENSYDLLIPKNASAFYYLLKFVPDAKQRKMMVTEYKKQIKTANEEIWTRDLLKRGYLLSIALYINENISERYLINSDSLLEAIKRYISINTSFIAPWHKEKWSGILGLIAKTEKEQLKQWMQQGDELPQKTDVVTVSKKLFNL